jgi:hypothetical protein
MTQAFSDQIKCLGANPRCFGVWGVIGRKAEVQNPNGVSAKCAIDQLLQISLPEPRSA